MIRTLVNLEPEDKAWIDQTAKLEHVSIAEVIRRAVHDYRLRMEKRNSPDFNELLQQTRKIWRKGDGLKYQKEIRDEWE